MGIPCQCGSKCSSGFCGVLRGSRGCTWSWVVGERRPAEHGVASPSPRISCAPSPRAGRWRAASAALRHAVAVRSGRWVSRGGGHPRQRFWGRAGSPGLLGTVLRGEQARCWSLAGCAPCPAARRHDRAPCSLGHPTARGSQCRRCWDPPCHPSLAPQRCRNSGHVGSSSPGKPWVGAHPPARLCRARPCGVGVGLSRLAPRCLPHQALRPAPAEPRLRSSSPPLRRRGCHPQPGPVVGGVTAAVSWHTAWPRGRFPTLGWGCLVLGGPGVPWCGQEAAGGAAGGGGVFAGGCWRSCSIWSAAGPRFLRTGWGGQDEGGQDAWVPPAPGGDGAGGGSLGPLCPQLPPPAPSPAGTAERCTHPARPAPSGAALCPPLAPQGHPAHPGHPGLMPP